VAECNPRVTTVRDVKVVDYVPLRIKLDNNFRRVTQTVTAHGADPLNHSHIAYITNV
jgi:hypothetical protein